jgi:hypothetical protein
MADEGCINNVGTYKCCIGVKSCCVAVCRLLENYDCSFVVLYGDICLLLFCWQGFEVPSGKCVLTLRQAYEI